MTLRLKLIFKYLQISDATIVEIVEASTKYNKANVKFVSKYTVDYFIVECTRLDRPQDIIPPKTIQFDSNKSVSVF